jgi:hypothetical protein
MLDFEPGDDYIYKLIKNNVPIRRNNDMSQLQKHLTITGAYNLQASSATELMRNNGHIHVLDNEVTEMFSPQTPWISLILIYRAALLAPSSILASR